MADAQTPTLVTAAFLQTLPKVELHLHIEGTLEPELMLELAERNQLPKPFASVEEARAAYNFKNLQSFLDIYYAAAAVLITEKDFHDLAYSYLKRASQQANTIHCEMFFDPQTHTARGISFKTVIEGLRSGMARAEAEFGMSSMLIMCFLRHLSEEDAMVTLEQALPFKEHIVGVGLDSGEKDRPPELFQRVFERARQEGFHIVAHAGEEGPAEYIWQALQLLQAERIDHGVRCVEDSRLMDHLAKQKIPLTVCPLSNIRLCVFDSMASSTLPLLLQRGLCVTLNSDDPAFFGGGLEKNFEAVHQAFPQWTREDWKTISLNSVEATFLADEAKRTLKEKIEAAFQLESK